MFDFKTKKEHALIEIPIYFEGLNEEIGTMGSLFAACGIIGALVSGPVMDKTHRYKLN